MHGKGGMMSLYTVLGVGCHKDWTDWVGFAATAVLIHSNQRVRRVLPVMSALDLWTKEIYLPNKTRPWDVNLTQRFKIADPNNDG